MTETEIATLGFLADQRKKLYAGKLPAIELESIITIENFIMGGSVTPIPGNESAAHTLSEAQKALQEDENNG